MKTIKFMLEFGLCVTLTAIVTVGVVGVVINLLNL